MKALDYLKNYYLLVLALLLFLGAVRINKELDKPLVVLSKQDETWNLNDEMVQKFNLGFKRLESSFLWISTILESDIEHYKEKNLNSWMFRRFNSISKLEPKFYENYIFGGMYLSIIKDDTYGAGILYKKGLLIYPNDYTLLKDAAYHFHFESKDLETSYILFKRLSGFPNEKFLPQFTLSKIEAQNGNLNQAFFILSEFQKRYLKDTFVGKKIYEYRYSLKAEIDLNCLNHNERNCSRYDLDNRPYQVHGKKYYASKAWVPYRLRLK